eukprot:CAMPEP_0171058562 /NCGR_PEP_ID=MMETSP0766_2-20121228/2566_1 /TAXON_ID=439317 /ORGANISM="Gambierdiscus australes, Strain CAWD 149" /LENGTH=39 /DNA_ID= /DNA_START= /DNA_END= /DNA_ORIENTATION=
MTEGRTLTATVPFILSPGKGYLERASDVALAPSQRGSCP